MTVRLLRAYGGVPAGGAYDGSADDELALVNGGNAVWDTRGAGALGGPGDVGGSGGGVDTTYTAAQLTALAAAGGLTPYATYVASDTGARYWASDASTLDVQLTGAEQAALSTAVANGLATDDSETINNKAGIPTTMAALLALAEINAYPRPFTIYQQGALGTVTQPAATWTSVTASNNGSGKLRLTSAGVHGLATTGRKIYVQFATTGTGLHEIATIVDTTTLDFTTDYSAVSGAVTVYPVGASSYCLDTICTVPGGTMGPNGSVDVEMTARFTNNASAKALRLYFGGSQVGEASYSSTETAQQLRARICNLNDAAVQASAPMKMQATSGGYSTTINTASDAILSLRFQVPTADHYFTLDSIRVSIVPGL